MSQIVSYNKSDLQELSTAQQTDPAIATEVTETDLENGCLKLFDLKVQGVISPEEEFRRKKLIVRYMESQTDIDDADEEQSISIWRTISHGIDTLSVIFPCLVRRRYDQPNTDDS